MRRHEKNLTVAVAVASLLLVGGCAEDTEEFAVGDCIASSVNQDGAAYAMECGDSGALKIDQLAGNGGRPDCGQAWAMGSDPGELNGPAKYVVDVLSKVTYCGYEYR